MIVSGYPTITRLFQEDPVQNLIKIYNRNVKRSRINAIDKEMIHNIRYFGNTAITSSTGPISSLIKENIRIYDVMEAENEYA